MNIRIYGTVNGKKFSVCFSNRFPLLDKLVKLLLPPTEKRESSLSTKDSFLPPVVVPDPEYKLIRIGPNKIQTIKVIRTITGMGLKEAKDVVDSVEAGKPWIYKPSNYTYWIASRQSYNGNDEDAWFALVWEGKKPPFPFTFTHLPSRVDQ